MTRCKGSSVACFELQALRWSKDRRGDESCKTLSEGPRLVQNAGSYYSDGTWESQQATWHFVPSGEVSSTASPEVLGAVDLLSLKQASWTRPLDPGACSDRIQSLEAGACPAKLRMSKRFSQLSDPACCALQTEAFISWPADSTSSSTGSRACGVEEDEPAAAANQQQAASAQCQPVLKAVKLAKCSLNRKKGNTPHAAKGRARDPTCIKEWAALTTWLRMNLHQARGPHRRICFLGTMSAKLGRWVFDLNPELPWSELSRETKQRLRVLPKEAEQAFAHKYPCRDSDGWQDKAVKYKPERCSDAQNVLMGHLVYDLHRLYLKHEVHSRRTSML